MRRWQRHGKSLENNSVRKMKNLWSGMPKERRNWPRNIRIIQESTKWLTFYNKRTGIFGDIKSFVGLFLYKCPKVAVSVNDVSILVAMTG